ncbi:PD-(D/E)XK nuclease domain-containing protein [Homoserinimonas sp. A520]
MHDALLRDTAPEKKLDEHRDGTMWSTGIQAYLLEPRKPSAFAEGAASNPEIFSPWQHPFEKVRERMEKQRSMLLDASPSESAAELVASDLASVLRRLPHMLRTLSELRPEWHMPDEIRDEHDLQVVVGALLRTLFDDVRPEDYVPSKGGRNSRVDFVIPEVGVVIETKMMRPGLSALKVSEELLIDSGRYPNHPDCDAIIALVYDPNHRITNPKGLERDLTMRTQSGLSFQCVIIN